MPIALTLLALLVVPAYTGAEAKASIIPACITTHIAESERGDRMMTLGQYDLAASAYRAAQRASCDGVGEVRLYAPLAEAECRAGRVGVGQALLADYACMLGVVFGKQECGMGMLTDRCRETMCAEAAFEIQGPFHQLRLDSLIEDARAARLACGFGG